MMNSGGMQMPRLKSLTPFLESGIRLREDLVDPSFRWLPPPGGSIFLTDSESPKTQASCTSAPEPTETPSQLPDTKPTKR